MDKCYYINKFYRYMKKAYRFIIPILTCFLIGFIAGRIQENSILNWYPYLNKPSLTPPNVAFPIAWTILYLCMGISIGLILNSAHSGQKSLIRLFILQLIFNFTWSIFFFYMQNPLLGLINIILLEFLIIVYSVKSYGINKISSVLFIPYILWVAYATYLNLYILVYN